MRKLCSKDIFPMCTIISKIGVKEFKSCFQNDEITKIMNAGKEGEDVTSVVGVAVFIDMAGIVLSNIDKCEKDIYSFLASVSETDIEVLQEMPISDFVEMIVEFFQKEELKDFMKVVSKFLK